MMDQQQFYVTSFAACAAVCCLVIVYMHQKTKFSNRKIPKHIERNIPVTINEELTDMLSVGMTFVDA